jgi:hypothetical protein
MTPEWWSVIHAVARLQQTLEHWRDTMRATADPDARVRIRALARTQVLSQPFHEAARRKVKA